MKTAIVCDWLVAYAGSERVLEQIINIYPDADVFALVDFLPNDQRGFLKGKKIKTTFIQKMPRAKTMFRKYLPLMPLAIEQFDLRPYDLVISSSHCVAKGIITGPNQMHISYVHSPIRYAWDLQGQYLEETNLKTGLKGFIAKMILHYMRIWDTRTSNGVDFFISNSRYIAKRIWKCYRREAETIYPPVDIENFEPCSDKEDFYITVSRMVPYKRIDLIVKAFAEMPDKKLIVIGTGSEFDKITSYTPSNVTFLGYQPFEVLKDYMQRAKGFVFCAEEDFGITLVEAQACGTPVIAYGKGGALETVLDVDFCEHPTGILFHEQNVSSIKEAIIRFENNFDRITTANCRNNAERFSHDIFKNQFKSYIDKCCIDRN